jgi:hypothetical protein
MVDGHAEGLLPIDGLDDVDQAHALEDHFLDLPHRARIVYQ